MKKYFILALTLVMAFSFVVPAYAYILSPEEIYGEPDRGYDEGYDDGYEDGGGGIIYRTREVTAKEYIADHETRFRELYITFFLVLAICVAPVLIFRCFIYKDSFDSGTAALISAVYNILASVLITYIMYRIDYLVPCISIVVLWGMICKKILAS